MKKIILLSLALCGIFILSDNPMAGARINPVPMGTNSPYKNGINDSCGGCVSPLSCQSGTGLCWSNFQTTTSACGASQSVCGANQACMSGSCVSTIDGTSCYPSGTCTNGGTCGGTVASFPNGQGSVTMTGICACSNGFLNDNNNCGSCAIVCTGSTAYCSFGRCIDANLCGNGGCLGSNCTNVTQIGKACSDTTIAGTSIYAGGNLEVSPVDVLSQTWAGAQAYCTSLGAG